ncbi:MAG: Holliday junction branch migration protein RuvA [Acetivibrionales bacterium]|jgi:Holliday junction DNA helicase RuvA
MYAYIKGKLEARGSDYIIIEAGGIGYRVNVPLSTLEAAGQPGSDFKIFTHLYVREDIMSLYGFATQEELNMFEMLLTVSGVGPKAALSLISAVAPSRFGLAVITDDAKTLTRAQGIGKKLAQRIILELKDKIKKEQLATAVKDGFEKADVQPGSSRISEAVSALIVLGYTRAEASRAVASVYSEDSDTETVVKNALKSLIR